MSDPIFPALALKNRFETDYILLEKLGSGAFSEVNRCQNKKTQKDEAVKIVRKKDLQDPGLLQSELKILTRVNHPNILAFKHLYESPQFLYMVMEMLTGGELFDRIVARGSYSENYAARAVQDILSATQYLHSQGIVHRDLKPENLIYRTDQEDSPLKIVDFGLSAELPPGGALTQICGTPGYVAPECFEGKPYNESVDLWSIGVIVYIMLCGFEPFYEETDEAMFARILKADYSFPSPYWDGISENAKDLIEHLITLNPAKRLTAVQAAKHRWVTGHAASTKELPETYKRIREFNARRKLKASVRTVQAFNRLRSFVGSFTFGEKKDESPKKQ